MHLDREDQRVRIAPGLGTHFDDAVIELIQPSARFRRHLEGGRHSQQLPAPFGLHKHAQTMRLKQAQIAVHR